MDNMLTVRQRKLLGILNNSSTFVKGKELASLLGVTDRTIRSDIQVLSTALEPYHSNIEAVKGRGYLLHTSEPWTIQKLTYNAFSLLSPEDRMRAISMHMIRSETPLDLGELEDEMFVSQSTLQVDVQNIRNEYSLNRPYIRLIRHKNTICFEDNEWKKRYVMNLIMTWDWNYNYEAGMTAGNMPLPAEEMALLDRTLHELLHKEDIHLTEHDYIGYLCSIGIAVYRIREGHGITERVKVLEGEEAVSTLSQEVVRQVGRIIRTNMKVDLSEIESRILSFELDCRNRYSPTWGRPAGSDADDIADGTFSGKGSGRAADGSRAEVLVQQMFDRIAYVYKGDLRQVAGLKEDLSLTLSSQLHNPFHSGVRDEQMRQWIRRAYPVCLDAAAALSASVREAYGRPVRQMDICETAAFLADGMTTDRGRLYTPRCAFVSHFSRGGSHTLMAQLRSLFDGRMIIEGPFAVYEESSIAEMDYDLILLTTKVRQYSHDCPVVVWSENKFKENIELINFYLDLVLYRRCFRGRSEGLSAGNSEYCSEGHSDGRFAGNSKDPSEDPSADRSNNPSEDSSAEFSKGRSKDRSAGYSEGCSKGKQIYLHQLLRMDHFQVMNDCASFVEVIQRMGSELAKEGIVENEDLFVRNVLQRESEMTTANPVGFAIPHAAYAETFAERNNESDTNNSDTANMLKESETAPSAIFTRQSGMYVCHITKGVNWGKERIFWVILLFFTKEESILFPQVYGRLMKVMNRAIQEKRTDQIVSVSDFTQMLMLMEGI